MSYTFTVDKDLKVIVKEGTKKIDEVGPWADAEGAEYWAQEMAKKYGENPSFVYPNEEPNVETL